MGPPFAACEIRPLTEDQDLVLSHEQLLGNDRDKITVSGLYKYLLILTTDKGPYKQITKRRMGNTDDILDENI